MIVCPNCNHPNPDGAQTCESCYTPLPATTSCPNCGATVQADAAFCGQCGTSLHSSATAPSAPESPKIESPQLQPPETVSNNQPLGTSSSPSSQQSTPLPSTVVSMEPESGEVGAAPSQPSPTPGRSTNTKTQLQQQTARLLHLQTDTSIELPTNLPVIHIGKSNERVPPDIDVSGFPHSEVVSRVHADIRVEGDSYYIEDVGSSNGTYINNMPLLPGNRHRLRPGDRIALGKGDLVTLLFQLS